jgi:hypothetical protein
MQKQIKALVSAACLLAACDHGAPSAEPWVAQIEPQPTVAVLRRLSREELAGTFRALLGAVPENLSRLPPDSSDLSASIPPVSNFEVEVYREIADEAARLAAPGLIESWACGEELACLQNRAGEWIETAQRRELPDDDRASYLGLLTNTSEDALRSVLDVVFQTPHFLYLIESRESDTLGSWELATRLSYLLWSEPPDEALRADVRNGELTSSAVLEGHARRMLQDPRAARAVGTTLAHWAAPDLAVAVKAYSVYPQLDAELRASMSDQFEQFAALALTQGFNLEQLLTTRQAPLDARLGTLLGARDKLDPQAQWTVITFDEPRFGLLTLPGVLSSRARPDDSSPVQRGLFIRDGMLCQPVPDPPPGVAALPPPSRPGATFRERFEAHTTDPTCAGCHRLMDPLGFPFEIYDGIGRLRENYAEIATEGTLDSVDKPADFQDISGLVHALLATPELARCWATHWITRLLGREASRNEALVAQISAHLGDGASLRDIIIEIVSAPELRSQHGN